MYSSQFTALYFFVEVEARAQGIARDLDASRSRSLFSAFEIFVLEKKKGGCEQSTGYGAIGWLVIDYSWI